MKWRTNIAIGLLVLALWITTQPVLAYLSTRITALEQQSIESVSKDMAVRALFSKHVNDHANYRLGVTLLSWLTIYEDERIMASPDSENTQTSRDLDDVSALMRAELLVKNRHIINIKALLTAGTNVDSTDELGNSALVYTAIHGELQILKILLAAGANVNSVNSYYTGGWTPLINASMHNSDTEIIAALLTAGADVHMRSRAGNITALHAAVSPFQLSRENPRREKSGGYNQLANVKALLAAGADVHAQTDAGASILHRAVSPLFWNEGSQIGIIQTVLKAGADVNVANKDGDTPLLKAVRNNDIPDPEVIKLLITAGASVNVINKNGHTPLYYATRRKDNDEITKVLLTAGADTDVPELSE